MGRSLWAFFRIAAEVRLAVFVASRRKTVELDYPISGHQIAMRPNPRLWPSRSSANSNLNGCRIDKQLCLDAGVIFLPHDIRRV